MYNLGPVIFRMRVVKTPNIFITDTLVLQLIIALFLHRVAYRIRRIMENRSNPSHLSPVLCHGKNIRAIR